MSVRGRCSDILSLGIAYQLIPLDPLIDEAQCKRDAKLMKELKANAIRVYHVDPAADHKGCMAAFAEVGIYLFVDLDSFDTQLSQVGHQPASVIVRVQRGFLPLYHGRKPPSGAQPRFPHTRQS
jgi:hypothetical protein